MEEGSEKMSDLTGDYTTVVFEMDDESLALEFAIMTLELGTDWTERAEARVAECAKALTARNLPTPSPLYMGVSHVN